MKHCKANAFPSSIEPSLLFENGSLVDGASAHQQNMQSGVFETMRVRFLHPSAPQALILGLDLHLARLHEGAHAYGFQAPRLDVIKQVIALALRRFYTPPHSDARLRIVAQDNYWSLSIQPWKFSPGFLSGVRLCSSFEERSNPEQKHCQAPVCRRARAEAERKGFQEALLISNNGMIREGAWSNFFWADQAQVVHTTHQGVLPGITRTIVEQLINEHGMRLVVSCTPFRRLIEQAHAACITQATHGIVLATSIDDFPFPSFEPFLTLQNAYENLFLLADARVYKLEL